MHCSHAHVRAVHSKSPHTLRQLVLTFQLRLASINVRRFFPPYCSHSSQLDCAHYEWVPCKLICSMYSMAWWHYRRAQMRSSPMDASHTDTNTTNDNLMDKLIYTDQSTCAIGRGTVTTEQSADRHCQVLLTTMLHLARSICPPCKWQKPQIASSLQVWGCLPMPSSSIRDMIDQFVCCWLDSAEALHPHQLSHWIKSCLFDVCRLAQTLNPQWQSIHRITLTC